MRALSDHLEAINQLLPALHDGFFVERYDATSERLVILGTRDISYHRDLVIICDSPIEVRFKTTFDTDSIRLAGTSSGQSILEFLNEGNVVLFVRGGFFTFECSHF